MNQEEAKAEFNRILNNLVHLRDQYTVYADDWGSLPGAFKTAIKARVVTVTNAAAADLSALSTAIGLQ